MTTRRATGVALLVLAVLLVLVSSDGPTARVGNPIGRDAAVDHRGADPTDAPTPDVGIRTGGADVGDAQGFGSGVTGGLGGDVYWVTSLADDGPGTLRAALAADGPRWIRFQRPGKIELESPLQVPSDTTIDGRDARVEIAVDRDVTAMEVVDVQNVIIHNLVFVGGRATRHVKGEPRSDALNLLHAEDVWIDHNTMTGWGDKLIGIPTATRVTVSYNHLHDHEECILVGARSLPDGSRNTEVTIHNNHFDGCASRSPRIGDGSHVHFFNNVVRHWALYGAAAVRGAQLRSEHNIFIADTDPHAIITDSGRGGQGAVHSTCDVTLGPAEIQERDAAQVFDPAQTYPYAVRPAGDAVRAYVEAWAGHQPSLAADQAPALPTDEPATCVEPTD